MKENEKKESMQAVEAGKEKIRKVIEETKKIVTKRIENWQKQTVSMKVFLALRDLFGVIVLAMLLPTLFLSVAVTFLFIWERLGMKFVFFVTLIICIIGEEIKKNGLCQFILNLLAIVILFKIAGELTNSDTKAIDEILKWIAQIPSFVVNVLIPYVKFW